MSDTQPTPEHEIVSSALQPHEWHFSDLLSVLYKRRWVAITTFLAVVTAVTVHTLRTTPIYEAHAQLLAADRPSTVVVQGVAEQQNDQRGYLETQYRLLQSRSLARRVIDELNLWNAADLTPTKEENSTGVSEFLTGWQSRPTSPPPTTPDASEPSSAPKETALGETPTESRTIDALLSHLRIEPVRNTRIVEVTYEAPNPVFAARVVNTLTSAYIKQHVEVRSSASQEVSTWLTNQLAEQRQKMEASELALQQYRERENSLSLEAGQNIVVQRLNALNSTVTQAKTDRIAVEALYRQLAASQDDRGALETFPQIRSNGVVQQLKEQLATLQRERMQLSSSLGAKHPDMVRVNTAIEAGERELASEIAKTVESVRKEYLAALSREKELTAALETQKGSALALNRQAVDYGVLLREAESNRQLYQSLLQRTNETAAASDLSNDLRSSDIEVVDAAEVPRAPVGPNTRTNLLLGLLLGSVMAIGMAVLLEAFDTRIQTPADVKRALRLPFLGMLPHVSSRALKGSAPLLSTGVPAVYAEACRSLRTNVIASAGGKGSRSLLVTSAAPGDGKSIVAVNLAVALGRSGRRVLIVDADLRRPTLHRLLGRKQHPGLSEVLVGTRKPSEAVVATRCSGVWLLASGWCPANPSELLGSRRFKEFLDKLGEYFDWVIIDSPPVMAVTDAAVVAHLTSGVLFVVNARRTRRKVAQAALDRLESAGASFAGAVLNSITLERDHYYNAHSYIPFYGDYLSDDRRTA